MDNVIQNINIEDIIPSKFQPNNEEKRKIEELAQLIKAFGLIDPILVRPTNGKYEIILGMDKYQAALKANLTKIPAIVKEVDDEVYSKYSNIDNNQQTSLNSLSSEKWTSQKVNDNPDVINLSELSKIKIEYERDDVKMNNEQLNNMAQSSINQGPTFGDRFFPSLEDQPTNMNMMGGMTPPPQPEIPNLGSAPEVNNNLIDLTDLSIDKEPTMTPPTDLGVPTINTPTLETTPAVDNNMIAPGNIGPAPTEQAPIVPNNETIINLDSLQNNNPAVQPISEPVSMEILNADFGAPAQSQPPIDIPQNINLQVPQGIEPSQPINMGQPEIIPNIPTPMSPEPPVINPQPSLDINQPPSMNVDLGTPAQMTSPEPTVGPMKDITPVTSTIRSLVSSLGTFGYKINITQEDLPTSAKIIIEIEK